jgi:hypothetical protein
VFPQGTGTEVVADFYAREGVPYDNVYAYVDSGTRGVLKVEVENLWW